jgi:effector-binding domain-containing protein
MNLTEEPEIVEWPATHFVFVERVGPFMKKAPEAWDEVHRLKPLLTGHNTITGAMSLYRMSPDTYRAGFSLAKTPVKLPDGLRYELFEGGRYSKFVLTGPYAEIGPATRRVWEMVSKSGTMIRPAFAIESYPNDPKVTPEEKLITEILIPVQVPKE